MEIKITVRSALDLQITLNPCISFPSCSSFPSIFLYFNNWNTIDKFNKNTRMIGPPDGMQKAIAPRSRAFINGFSISFLFTKFIVCTRGGSDSFPYSLNMNFGWSVLDSLDMFGKYISNAQSGAIEKNLSNTRGIEPSEITRRPRMEIFFRFPEFRNIRLTTPRPPPIRMQR